MEKNVGALLTILAILCLVVGFTTGYVMAPEKEKIVEKEIIKEVPTEVVKEIETIVEITSTDTQPLLDAAIADFLEEVEDVEDCDDEEYDEDQIKVKKIFDKYSINYDDGYEVVFEVKLKYLDKDTEEKCYNTFDVSVYYEEDEDPEIEILA